MADDIDDAPLAVAHVSDTTHVRRPRNTSHTDSQEPSVSRLFHIIYTIAFQLSLLITLQYSVLYMIHVHTEATFYTLCP